ncbi:MAG: GGDEF domain-containing protein [Deltaproteobacteria bacterium]
MSRFNAAADPELLIRDLEQRVQQYPFRAVRITGSREELLGLFLLPQDVRLTESDLQNAFAAIFERQMADGLSPAVSVGDAGDSSAEKTNIGSLEELLACQIERTRQTRLPCAFILLEPDAQEEDRPEKMMPEITGLVQAAVRRSDILLRCDIARLAVILPSISLREATDCAERIRQALARKPAIGEGQAPTVTASIGIGLCYAGDQISAETFAANVARELARARRQGGNQVCRVIDSRTDRSCQVSVEERAELFSIFLKERQS